MLFFSLKGKEKVIKMIVIITKEKKRISIFPEKHAEKLIKLIISFLEERLQTLAFSREVT